MSNLALTPLAIHQAYHLKCL